MAAGSSSMVGERGGAVRRALSTALLVAVAVLWVGPYLWMTLTSFKTLDEIVRDPTALLPHALDLGAYREVFAQVPVLRYFANTVVMSVAIALLQIMLALPAGYALAKLRFKGRGAALGLVLACLLVPAQVTTLRALVTL